MFTCNRCEAVVSDAAKCSLCGNQYDFPCAGITEAGWRKLGERKNTWRCSNCKGLSPRSNTHKTMSTDMENILAEIRHLSTQMSTLPAMMENIKAMQDQLSDLKSSMTCIQDSVKELKDNVTYLKQEVDLLKKDKGRIDKMENRLAKHEKIDENVQALKTTVDLIKLEHSINDQRSRLNNVEIKGIPIKNNENLFNILESISQKISYNFPKTQINYITRIPQHNSHEKAIIVSFLNRYVKEDFVAAARASRILSSQDLGFLGSAQRIYINDHLNSDSKKLLNKTKQLAKERDFKYVWVKHCKIHLRKSDDSKVYVINNDADLNKLM